jgi:hypothetical protein
LIGLLALLNAVVLAAGLSLEHVRGQPAALVDFNADKVRLLGRVEGAPAVPAKVAEAMPATEGQAPAGQAKESAPAALLKPRCLAWSGLDEGLLGEIETRLQGAGIAASRYDIHLQTRLGWWVYLPPFADAAATQAAIDAARQKGIEDISPVRGGRMENAVSLGVFPTLAKARAQMGKLRALGLQGLRMGPRPNSGNARLTIADDVPEAKLAGLGEGWGKERAPLACAGN